MGRLMEGPRTVHRSCIITVLPDNDLLDFLVLVDGLDDATLSVGVDVPDVPDFVWRFLTAICLWTDATAATDLVFFDPIARAFCTIFDALADSPPSWFQTLLVSTPIRGHLLRTSHRTFPRVFSEGYKWVETRKVPAFWALSGQRTNGIDRQINSSAASYPYAWSASAAMTSLNVTCPQLTVVSVVGDATEWHWNLSPAVDKTSASLHSAKGPPEWVHRHSLWFLLQLVLSLRRASPVEGWGHCWTSAQGVVCVGDWSDRNPCSTARNSWISVYWLAWKTDSIHQPTLWVCT